MTILLRSLFVCFFFSGIACGETPATRIPSPSKKYQLVVEYVPEPGAPGQTWISVSVADRNGKNIQQIYTTVFPILAIKWHKTADAVMVLEHLAQTELVSLVVLKNGSWKRFEMDQFEDLGYFTLIDAKSAPASFTCFLIADPYRYRPDFITYCASVSIVTGEAKLKKLKHLSAEELLFCKPGPANIISQMQETSGQKTLRFEDWPPDDEPDWYGVKW